MSFLCNAQLRKNQTNNTESREAKKLTSCLLFLCEPLDGFWCEFPPLIDKL